MNKTVAQTGESPVAKPPGLRPSHNRLAQAAIISFVAGLFGGLVSFLIINDYFALTGNRGRSVVLEESSAIIDVAQQVGPSVVRIVTERVQTDIFGRTRTVQAGVGSGLIIDSEGLVLTNKHVIPDDVSRIVVNTGDGREFDDARVVARDPFNDIAYVKINASNMPAANLGDSDQVVVGQRVIAIGNALGELENTVTSGIISGLGRPITASDGSSEQERLSDLLQTDAAINPGNSGGPLVNIEGHVIGINTAIAGGAENIGFAIPINQAKAGIASIERTGKLEKPYLGVRYVNIDARVARAHNLPVTDGAYIIADEGEAAILVNSPAAKAGLKAKDIIRKVNDDFITARSSLVNLIGKYRVGETIRLQIRRGDEELTISVVLEALPQE